MQEESIITLSDKAAKRVSNLIEAEGVKYRLRIYITGGGCSGFTYGFTFDDKQNEDDFIVHHNSADVDLIVDPISLQYLIGATVDYEEGLMGNRFVVNNPAASNVCGCGSSFSI
ncbi:iron-sulfur cluster insertion protein ErpA [Psittacicella hinzii]|uniref:Iron-sulfur cluster insertion protein ErpA n=1 Tax=Psittacicella hinzii TaxID=2028575 RepID=A0A3A1YDU2_9GAMM|nr:iron-sulfur cluster insertion protein ErpA [Psittacicella hinzii]RIY35586.1 iron-sulfur cluster insertion protein ErpA [Psittacicella hinzii]